MVAEIFEKPKPILATVQLLPLPGAPHWSGQWDRLVARAEQEATALATGGVDALILENSADGPFSTYNHVMEPASAIAMALLVKRLSTLTGLPIGLSWLGNDPATALAIAMNTQAAFVRLAVSSGARLTTDGLLSSRFQEFLQAQVRLKVQLPMLLMDVTADHIVPKAAESSVLGNGLEKHLNHLVQVAHDLPPEVEKILVLSDADLFPEEVADLKQVISAPLFIEVIKRFGAVDDYFAQAEGLILCGGIRKNTALELGQQPTIDMTKVEEVVNRLRGVRSILEMPPEEFLRH
jgi:uncharacterized protein